MLHLTMFSSYLSLFSSIDHKGICYLLLACYYWQELCIHLNSSILKGKEEVAHSEINANHFQ